MQPSLHNGLSTVQAERNTAAATAGLLSSAKRDLHANETESARLHGLLVEGLLQAYGQVQNAPSVADLLIACCGLSCR